MTPIFLDNPESIGRTPLVRLNRITENGKAVILAKIEGRNPSCSVKCRIGAAMIWDAEKTGRLKPGIQLIEPTSGNTGIALASVAAAKGYKLTLTMPDTMSMERRKLLKAFGANLILTDGRLGMKGSVDKAEEIVAENPKRTVLLHQFKNPSNPAIHEKTTGPEIWEDSKGSIDVLVSGVGTGGTITGLSRYFKNKMHKPIVSVAVEPSQSPVISQTLAGKKPKPGPHPIQGIGAGFIPGILDLTLIDQVEMVTGEEAYIYARRLAREEGILAGISSGAAAAVAVRLGKMEKYTGKTIVVILPDSGERYLSDILFENSNYTE